MTPLKSGKPLSSTRKSILQPTAWKQRKVPLRARSKKMQEVYVKERIPLVKALLAEHPMCSARLQCCTRRAVDVHELKSRARGGSITDRENLVTLCRSCHSWITTHPREAKELNWLKSSWD